MRARIVLFATLVLVAPALAGCLGAKDSDLGDPRTVTASTGARVSLGWAYDGATVATTVAALEGTFNDAENSGSAVITFQLDGSAWRVEFDQFSEAPGATFQDGGIAFDIVEHGDSGVADASIPKILALIAAWGDARVSVDGTPVPDPSTGAAAWTAHLMVSDSTVRGVDGKMTKADGTTPYDPATPADASVVDGDGQVLFALKARPRPADVQDFQDNKTVTVTGPADEKAFTMRALVGGEGLVRVSVTPAVGGPLAAGDLTVTVKDPAGTEIGTQTVQVAPPSPPADVEIPFVAAVEGDYSVEIASRGAFRYDLGMSVVYPPPTFIALTWDEFEIS